MGLRVSESVVQGWIDRGLVAAGQAQTSAPPAVVDEKEFQAAVEDFAKRCGWLFYHTRDSRKSAAGFPDLVLLRGPLLIVAELKVGANVPTAEQSNWLDAFRAAGVVAYVWRPGDWGEIERVLT